MLLVCGVFHKWLGFLFPGPWQYRRGKIFGTPVEEKQLIIRNLPLILVSGYCNERLFTYISRYSFLLSVIFN